MERVERNNNVTKKDLPSTQCLCFQITISSPSQFIFGSFRLLIDVIFEDQCSLWILHECIGVCPVARRARFKSVLVDGMDHNSVATLWDALLHHLG